MPASVFSYVIEQYATFRARVRFKPAGSTEYPDFTSGYQSVFIVEEAGPQGGEWLRCSSADDPSRITFTADGWIELEIPAAQTGALECPQRELLFDWYLIEIATGYTWRLVEGQLRFREGRNPNA